jgi:[FeFe] hydrogenase H-cluster maturation GTPase HydF
VDINTALNKVYIAVLGKKGTGKSLLINTLLNDNRFKLRNENTLTDSDIIGKNEIKKEPVVLIEESDIEDIKADNLKLCNSLSVLSTADFAIVVTDATRTLSDEEKQLFRCLKKINIPYLIAVNKIELGINPILLKELNLLNSIHFEISCRENAGIDRLKTRLLRMLPDNYTRHILSDMIYEGDTVILVVPDNPESEENEIVLPQAEAIKNAVEKDSLVIITKGKEIRAALDALKSAPDLIITDSAEIKKIAAEVPENIRLTTYSILMARYKGDIATYVSALKVIDKLKDGDKILIAEACPNHPIFDDTGNKKIPEWLKQRTKKELRFIFHKGELLPGSLNDYKLIIHCGGCRISRKEMLSRTNIARLADVPIINYGVLISYMQGIIPRALYPIDEAIAALVDANLYCTNLSGNHF